MPASWSNASLLLLSDRPIPGQSGLLSDAALATLAGGSGYACNDLLQEAGAFPCDGSWITTTSVAAGRTCVYAERWGCGPADSGTCTEQPMISWAQSPCVPDLHGGCTITGDWAWGYMFACQ